MKKAEFLKEIGDKYGDFVLKKCLSLPELNATLKELVHLPSGAQIMQIENDDPENLFCLSFKTLPDSSNGAAHILEHTVLCGSKKFPVKDPFFAMNRRSLNTFMNALTGSDFTCYPASSLNEKDFYNLLEVYLDAVFHPELKLMSFLQEGHRLEISDTKLEHKGIVFNEMKGSLSSVDSRLWHAMMAELLPDLPYAFNSGGDPKEIPHLTYEELISFHEKYYHPSRCLFFFYGNFPLKTHLDFLEAHTLKNCTAKAELPPLPRQKRFQAPKVKQMSYPVNEETERSIFAFGFLTAPLVDQEEVLALCLLDSILMETDASLLKRALLRSKLCVQADAYIDAEISEVPYVIVCKGCKKGEEEALEKVLQKALEKIAQEGIPSHLVDAAIHQLELARSEITGDHSPFGLTLFMRSALAKQHGCPAENALSLHALFASLVVKLKDPSYLKELLHKHFIANTHRVRLELHPDAALVEKEKEEEEKELQRIQERLTSEEKNAIVKQSEELIAFQKTIEAQSLDCLPKVTLEDVSLTANLFPLHKHHTGILEVFHHECFTNQILYADILFDLPHVADEDLIYVQLFTSLLTEVGAAERSYEENLEFIQAHTGGIAASCALYAQVDDPSSFRPALHLRGKALHRNAEKLLTLMRETLTSPRFCEKERVKELLLQLRESQLNQLNKRAMRYATQLSLSAFNRACHIHEAWHGLRYFKAIEQLCENLDANLPKIIDKCMELRDYLLSWHAPHLVLSCNHEMLELLKSSDFYGLSNIAARKSYLPWKEEPLALKPHSQGKIIPSQVAFTSYAFKAIPYIHPSAAALTVATNLFENKILHSKIREQGGAYGAGATYNSTLNALHFYAYRDPHLTSSLAAFENAIETIASRQFSTQDLEEAKLGILQHLDAPIPPGSRGITAYGYARSGKSDAMRQEFRERLLHATAHDVQRAIELSIQSQKQEAVTVCFAGKELLERENKALASQGKDLPLSLV